MTTARDLWNSRKALKETVSYQTGQVTILVETPYKRKPGTYFKRYSRMAVLNVNREVNARATIDGRDVIAPFEEGYNNGQGAYVVRLPAPAQDSERVACEYHGCNAQASIEHFFTSGMRGRYCGKHASIFDAETIEESTALAQGEQATGYLYEENN